jgi:uncharacterized protein (DUF2267 family)
MTGLDSFDRTIQETNSWLKDLMTELNREDRNEAYRALRACLHTLRDRVTPDEAVDLAAQLPMLLRGVYYEGWKPSKTPEKIRTREEFLSRISLSLYRDPDIDAEEIARATFKLLSERISRGEVDDIKSNLPDPIEDLWPRGG